MMTRKFKRGDRIKCIIPKDKRQIEVGRMYTVIKTIGYQIDDFLIELKEVDGRYYEYRFELVSQQSTYPKWW